MAAAAARNRPGHVFVNFSPQQLIDDELAAVIADRLSALGLPTASLGIEITEKALDDNRVRPSAAYYQAAGHLLAIDDFGTGYSSLARLIELPVSYLKLDWSLVLRLPGDPQAKFLLHAFMVIVNSLNLTVIGEGVENAVQAECLAEAGCLLQQGYHHGRPEPAEQLTTTLTLPTARRLRAVKDQQLSGLVVPGHPARAVQDLAPAPSWRGGVTTGRTWATRGQNDQQGSHKVCWSSFATAEPPDFRCFAQGRVPLSDVL